MKYKVTDDEYCPLFEVGEIVKKCAYDPLERDNVNDTDMPLFYSLSSGEQQYVSLDSVEVIK